MHNFPATPEYVAASPLFLIFPLIMMISFVMNSARAEVISRTPFFVGSADGPILHDQVPAPPVAVFPVIAGPEPGDDATGCEFPAGCVQPANMTAIIQMKQIVIA